MLSPELLVPSFISLISGIVSLYTDPKNKEQRVWKWILLICLISGSITTVYFGYHNEQTAKKTEQEKNAQILNLDKNITQLTQQNLNLEKQNNTLLETVKQMQANLNRTGEEVQLLLRSFGWSEQNLNNPIGERVDQSLEANQVLNSLRGDPNRRQTITVQYFPKDVDPNILKTKLEDLGFTLVTGPPRNNLPTDSIWFGSDVDLNSVKAVAYTLIGAGIPLKAIRQFSQDNGRERTIQVGGDPDCSARPSLTVEVIQAADRFPLQREVSSCQMPNG